MSAIQRVKETVVRALDLQVDPEEIPDDEVLFGGGLGASSIAVMEVVVALEEEFDFEVEDDELRLERFESINSIVAYVESRLPGGGVAETPPSSSSG